MGTDGEAGPSPGAGKREYEVVVVGVGGAGCNFVDRMSSSGVRDITLVAVNTDRVHLEFVDADKKLLIGKDRLHGTGTGGDPATGRVCMEEAAEELAALLGSPDVVFVVAGLGGGTGSGGAPGAARVAKRCGATVLGVAFMPFRLESGRQDAARCGLEELRRSSDAVMVMENDRLLSMAPELPLNKAFEVFDGLVVERISALVESMRLPRRVLESEKILQALPDGRLAMVCRREEGEEGITCETLDHPLLEMVIPVMGGAYAAGGGAEVGATRPLVHSNVLVSARAGRGGGGREVVPLVAGMRTYSADAPPAAGAPRATRQTLLGLWTEGP
ncbi:MAG: hypothetical protein ACUVV6_02935 [Thermoplasmatota archaeon]